MKKKEASASCSALIVRSGQRVRAKRGPMKNSAASRRMAACTLVAILRDASKSALLRMRTTHRCRGHGFRACAKRRIPEWRRLKFIVMPALVAGIHVFLHRPRKTWMAGTKPGHDEKLKAARHALPSSSELAP